MKKDIKFFALGGMDEKSKNCYILEVEGSIYIFNVGVKRPDVKQVGIKYLVADFKYLVENKKRIKGIFIGVPTFDNYAGLEYLLTQLNVNVPVYTNVIGE